MSTTRNCVVVSVVVWTLLVALILFSYISPKITSTTPIVKNVHIDYIKKSSKIIQDGGIYIHGKYKALVEYAKAALNKLNPEGSWTPATVPRMVPNPEAMEVCQNHTYGDGTCPVRTDVPRLKEILAKWIDIATKNNITYFITWGSLLGAWRDGHVMPWDTDLDVYTEESDNVVLDKIQAGRGWSTYSQEFHLVLDADWKIKPVEKRRRMRCDGRNEVFGRDSCTFQGPVARLIKGYEKYLDVWDLEVRSEGTQLCDRTEGVGCFPREEIYPLKTCTLLGMNTWCPKNPEVIWHKWYGHTGTDRRSPWICKNKKWIKTGEFINWSTEK